MEFWNLHKRCLGLLPASSRRKFLFAALIQASLGLFDLVGVLLTGVIGAMASTSLTHLPVPTQITKVLKFFHLSQQDPATSIMILSFCALGFFLLKTGLALWFTRRTFKFLATQQSRISSSLVSKVLHSDYIWLRNQDPHMLSTTVILGVTAATVNALGQILILSSEFALVAIFFVLLIAVNPVIAIFTIVYMSLVLYALNAIVGRRVSAFNKNLSRLRIESERNFFNVLKLFREIRVFRRADWFESNLEGIFSRQAHYFAEDIWIQQIPKYALEVALLIGASGLLVAGRLSSNSQQIIPILVIYLASAARIFPSLLRMQSSIFSLRSHAFYTDKALDLLDTLELQKPEHANAKGRNQEAPVTRNDSGTSIELNNLSFSFPDSDADVLKNVSLHISPGERVAIVGPSGAGKSTLCDILLGLLAPTKGTIEIDSISADRWIYENVGKVSYLPQDITLVGGTLIENICLGIARNEIDPGKLAKAISRAQLEDFVSTLPLGVDSDLGIGIAKLSGGQKQRIGIARALYSRPNVLIMDEATSALDAETEHGIMNVLENFEDDVTVIFIAHRLSSIRDFPRILYFEDGELLADGDFSTVRSRVPRFNTQAALLGL